MAELTAADLTIKEILKVKAIDKKFEYWTGLPYRIALRARKREQNSDGWWYVVLCFVPSNSRHPWVTWLYNDQNDSYEHGNYFEENKLGEANTDFETR